MNLDDVEWRLTLTFANAVLRKGMEKEAEDMKEAMIRSRKYRQWLKNRQVKGWRKEDCDDEL